MWHSEMLFKGLVFNLIVQMNHHEMQCMKKEKKKIKEYL